MNTSSSAPKPQLMRQSSDSKQAMLRLLKDQKGLEEDAPDGISAAPMDSKSIYEWKACIFGPMDSPWEGGVLQLRLSFPNTYPQAPPKVRFTSVMFHPNVYSDGSLCLDILQDKWSPVHTVSSVLTSIQSLLTDPNPASPANPEAAQLFTNNQKQYKRRVRQCVSAAQQQ